MLYCGDKSNHRKHVLLSGNASAGELRKFCDPSASPTWETCNDANRARDLPSVAPRVPRYLITRRIRSRNPLSIYSVKCIGFVRDLYIAPNNNNYVRLGYFSITLSVSRFLRLYNWFLRAKPRARITIYLPNDVWFITKTWTGSKRKLTTTWALG